MKVYKISDLAQQFNLQVVGNSSKEIQGISDINELSPQKIIPIVDKKQYQKYHLQINFFLIPKNLLNIIEFDKEKSYVTVDGNKKDFTFKLIEFLNFFDPFYKLSHHSKLIKKKQNENIFIGENCLTNGSFQIGKNTQLMGNNFIGDQCEIGEDCILYPGVFLDRGTKIGDRVTIYPNAVIGKSGFGFVEINESHDRIAIPQIGNVLIEDDVSIGAGVCIDRATISTTKICKGVKIDNLVQIAHNVLVGENSVMASQVGIAGSSQLGKNVILAGQAGVADHCIIGNDVLVGGQSGIQSKANVQDGEKLFGSPAIDMMTKIRLEKKIFNFFNKKK